MVRLSHQNDGAAQGVAVVVGQHQAVHLPGQGKARDIAGIHAALADDRLNGVQRGLPPVLRLLLRPAVIRLIQRILFQRGRDLFAVNVKQHGFGSRSAQVYANQILQIHPSPFVNHMGNDLPLL